MEKNKIIEALKKAREGSRKRNFAQSIDLVFNIKDVDLKKQDQKVDFFVTLKHSKGKKVKVGALVAAELNEEAKKVCDEVIIQDDFAKYAKDKKLTKKIAESVDFFIAQANIMPAIATSFGRVFGPKGKMPNPKSGCIVPPKTNLQPLYDKLQKTIRVIAKEDMIIHCVIGSEKLTDEELADNVVIVYDALIHHLPSEEQNIKSCYLKLTMGKPERLK
ncbi:MAG: 50S ribosomal protein L1 [bacterium]|nr:50S ribosomal protein L1 [bacterium]